MKIRQHYFSNDTWQALPSDLSAERCQLVMVFGEKELLSNLQIYSLLKQQYPIADIVFSSTAGEILGDIVFEKSIVATAIEFEKTTLKCVTTNIKNHNSSFEIGCDLMNQLKADDLKNVFIISDGTFVNGSELLEGFNLINTNLVPITGGLAGDGARFEETLAGINCNPAPGNVIAIGFLEII